MKRYHVLSKHNALLRMSPLKLAHPVAVRFTLCLKYRGDFSNLRVVEPAQECGHNVTNLIVSPLTIIVPSYMSLNASVLVSVR